MEPARHSERSEESRVVPDFRPFTAFRVTLKRHFSFDYQQWRKEYFSHFSVDELLKEVRNHHGGKGS